MTFDEWWESDGKYRCAEKVYASDAWEAATKEEREAIIALLLELGALGDGTYLEAIRARSNA